MLIVVFRVRCATGWLCDVAATGVEHNPASLSPPIGVCRLQRTIRDDKTLPRRVAKPSRSWHTRSWNTYICVFLPPLSNSDREARYVCFFKPLGLFAQPKNREVLAWLGGGFCVMVSGLCAAWTTLAKRRSKADPPKPAPRDQGALSQTREMPLAFWVLAGLDGLLIVWAILAPETRVTMDGSTFVGGDVQNRTILRINGDCYMQVIAPNTGRARDRGVLHRQNIPAGVLRSQKRRLRRLLKGHRCVPKPSRKVHLTCTIATKAANANALASARNQPIQKIGTPFLSRTSPKCPTIGL